MVTSLAREKSLHQNTLGHLSQKANEFFATQDRSRSVKVFIGRCPTCCLCLPLLTSLPLVGTFLLPLRRMGNLDLQPN
jgi:hypothetical protein